MAASGISSAGVKLKYCPEATAGTRPTTGYTAIDGLVSVPDFNQAPEQLETTTMDVQTGGYKTYIPGLRDTGGAAAFRFNQNATFVAAWEALVTAYAALSGGKEMWYEVAIPGQDSFYFAGEPTPLGLSGFGVNEVIQVDAYITPSKIEGFDTAST